MVGSEEILAYPTLPFGRVSAGMKDREHNDYCAFYREVHNIRKTFQKRSTDSGSEMRVLKRIFDNPIVGAPQFIEELQPETRLFLLIPIESRFDIAVGPCVRNQPVFCHRDFLPKRSRTS